MARDLVAWMAFLEERSASPFAWGRHANDCVSFSDGAIVAATGKSRLGDLSWTTVRGAARVLKRLGGMEAAVNARLPRISPARAQRGDIAGVPDERFGIRLMVIEGAMLVGPGTSKAARLPRAAMAMAWSIEGQPGE